MGPSSCVTSAGTSPNLTSRIHGMTTHTHIYTHIPPLQHRNRHRTFGEFGKTSIPVLNPVQSQQVKYSRSTGRLRVKGRIISRLAGTPSKTTKKEHNGPGYTAQKKNRCFHVFHLICSYKFWVYLATVVVVVVFSH